MALDSRKLKKESKIGRNALCPCQSGKKYKVCCWKKQQDQMETQREARRIAEAAEKKKELKKRKVERK